MSAPLTVPQAAALANRSAEYIRQRIRAGDLPAARFGRDYAVDLDDLAAWIARPKRRPGPPRGTAQAPRATDDA